MKMKHLLALIIAAALFGCSATKKQQKTSETATSITPSLELVWETDTLMTTAECIIYDKNRDLIYVSVSQTSSKEGVISVAVSLVFCCFFVAEHAKRIAAIIKVKRCFMYNSFMDAYQRSYQFPINTICYDGLPICNLLNSTQVGYF